MRLPPLLELLNMIAVVPAHPKADKILHPRRHTAKALHSRHTVHTPHVSSAASGSIRGHAAGSSRPVREDLPHRIKPLPVDIIVVAVVRVAVCHRLVPVLVFAQRMAMVMHYSGSGSGRGCTRRRIPVQAISGTGMQFN